jgi:hypothetical protein
MSSINLNRHFAEGNNGGIRLLNSSTWIVAGNSWSYVTASATEIDQWFVGAFSAAQYTIVAEYGAGDREILTCLVTATIDDAGIAVYGRSNLGIDLISLTATVDNAQLKLFATPTDPTLSGIKVNKIATYFEASNT